MRPAFALLLLAACGDDRAPDVLDRLNALPGVAVAEIPAAESGLDPQFRYFDLYFTQPEDHSGTKRDAIFLQYAALIHRRDDAPLVVYAGGYNASRTHTLTEPAAMLDANQISLEYRFYGKSRGEEIDWPYLDVTDAQEDQHAIVQAMETIYPGVPHVATGGSKGGEHALEAMRLHPEDYDAVVAYVPPVITDLPDPRYATVLDDIGIADCRDRLRALQRAMLVRRPAMEARANAEGSFRDVGLGKAVETAIVELEFSYWMEQTGNTDCAAIPAATASDDALYAFLDRWSSPVAYGDTSQSILGEQYTYQVLAQLGYPVWEHQHLDDLMMYSYEDMEPFLAEDAPVPTYDPFVARDLASWIANDANRIMIVGGEWDPWGAGYPASVSPDGDALRLIVPHGSHWSSGIYSLAPADNTAARAALARWTGVPLTDARVVPALPEFRGDARAGVSVRAP
ncbi:MAG TPA: S28 family serine protease [Kofleriaceae bacterium]|nr:S28 family serine protease [Kofleriaceae bacterium]